MVGKNLVGAKAHMKAKYDHKTTRRSFDLGNKVQVLVARPRAQLCPGFAGPYTVLKKLGDLNYMVATPDRRSKTHLYHVNSLKAYEGRVPEVVVCCVAEERGGVLPATGCRGKAAGHPGPRRVG